MLYKWSQNKIQGYIVKVNLYLESRESHESNCMKNVSKMPPHLPKILVLYDEAFAKIGMITFQSAIESETSKGSEVLRDKLSDLQEKMKEVGTRLS